MQFTPAPLSGIVLAAGRSTRMGRDKALLELGGIPLWQRQRDLLAEAGATEILLSARQEQSWAYAAKGFAAVVNDALPDCGPIVGLTAGLERTSQPHLAVVAIDLPAMTASWFLRLRQRCAPGGGCVGRRGDFFEPLAAIYPVEMKWLAWETIARGEYSLQTLLTAAVAQGFLQVEEIGDMDAGWFANWNEGGGEG